MTAGRYSSPHCCRACLSGRIIRQGELNMIYDKIDNLETYAGISEDLRIGLEWLRDVDADVENGVYEINPHVKAIVSEYITKEVNENGYEAHLDYIDIQYLISGEEVVKSLPLEYLNEIKPYNKEIDAAFYFGEYIQTPHNYLTLNSITPYRYAFRSTIAA